MLKILYAANNSISSFYTLKRFLDTYKQFYNIKVAAYTASIQNLNVSWNLDALLDFRDRAHNISFKNNNYAFYIREIKRFAPDIIISDLEIYSSIIALDLGITLWQVSPLLLYYSLNNDEINKYYSAQILQNELTQNYINYILNNSNKKLILSHLGDIIHPPLLKQGYEWVRPNQGKESHIVPCAIGYADAYYNYMSLSLDTNYKDKESIITSYYNKIYSYKEFNLNDVKYLSQHLKSLDINR